MNTYTRLVFASAACATIVLLAPVALAEQGSGRGVSDDTLPDDRVVKQLRTEDQPRISDDSMGTQTQSRTQTRTQTRDRDDSATSSESEDESGDDNGRGSSGRGEEHRSEVARFVQTLLGVADRDGGIGEQVRTIAREQASSSEKVVGAIDEVENRGKVRTFFFGSDYKNLGVIRSEVAQTRNRIEQLNRELERSASSTDTTMARAEIQTMEREQVRLETYIKDNEEKFSLFGWVVKMFE